MDFYSAYAHGFARVAACTVPIVIADPAANAEDGARAGARLPRRGRGARDLPRAVAVRLRDRRPAPAGRPARAASRPRSPRSSRPPPTCCRWSSWVHRCVHGTRVLNCAVVIHRGRVLGVAPKSYLPTYREFYERRQFAPGDDHRGSTIDRRGEVPFGPDLLFSADRRARADPPRRGLRGHVGADPAELRGGAGRRDGAGQPLRQPDHRRPRRGPAPAGPQRQRPLPRGLPLRRGRSGGVDHRPDLGRPDDGLRERRRCSPRASASPTGRGARSPTSTSTCCARSGCGRAPSTTTDGRTRAGAGVPHRRLRARPADRRPRAAPQGRPVPVRPRRRGAPRAGLLRGLQHPGLRPRAAARARSGRTGSPRS